MAGSLGFPDLTSPSKRVATSLISTEGSTPSESTVWNRSIALPLCSHTNTELGLKATSLSKRQRRVLNFLLAPTSIRQTASKKPCLGIAIADSPAFGVHFIFTENVGGSCSSVSSTSSSSSSSSFALFLSLPSSSLPSSSSSFAVLSLSVLAVTLLADESPGMLALSPSCTRRPCKIGVSFAVSPRDPIVSSRATIFMPLVFRLPRCKLQAKEEFGFLACFANSSKATVPKAVSSFISRLHTTAV